MNLEDKLYAVINNICRFFLFAMVLIVSFVVFGRYLFKYTPAWGEEMALFCMTWFGMLAAALAERRNAHIRISALDKVYPKPFLKILYKLYYIAKIVFALVLIIEGIKLTINSIPSMMSGIKISSSLLYVSGPVTGIVLLFFLLFRIKKELFS